MKQWLGVAFALVAAACTGVRPAAETDAPMPSTVEGVTTAIADDAERSEHAASAAEREHWADHALRAADACMALGPGVADCLYYRGVALGMNAKAHPARAGELLQAMIEALDQADAANPDIDQAGPSRVKALVLIRAPGWPLGPGDVETGLSLALRAVSLRPQYPPNQLALGEALAKNGDARGAREAYQHARDRVAEWSQPGDRKAWLIRAEQGLAAQ